jgi:hypothetical protein
MPSVSYPQSPSLQAFAGEDDEGRTIHGIAPQAPMRGKLDSREISTEVILSELASKGQEARAAQAEAAELRLQLRAHDAAYRLPKVEASRSTRPPTKIAWVKLTFSLLGALTVALGGIGAYFESRVADQSRKVENVEVKQKATDIVTEPLPADFNRFRAYLTAKKARDACVQAQLRNAIERGTGHSITSISDSVIVKWGTQEIPKPPHGGVWERPAYFPTTSCPEEPALP